MTRLRLFFSKIGLVVLHGARQAHLDFGLDLKSRAAARKNQARQKTQRHKIKNPHVGYRPSMRWQLQDLNTPIIAKRLGCPQQSNVYLEPKWLRCMIRNCNGKLFSEEGRSSRGSTIIRSPVFLFPRSAPGPAAEEKH